jgi:hypothetical protein
MKKAMKGRAVGKGDKKPDKQAMKGRAVGKGDKKPDKHAKSPSGQGIYGNKSPKGSAKSREKRLEGKSL